MSRLNTMDEVYSVLYVDFDNIYTRLYEQDPVLAKTFGATPQRWMRWIEGHALRMMYGDGVRRRILKRCCYLNPHRYHEFRPYFIRAAFQVVDCPPLTNYGKTSADIHLVMDCMDALAHTTRFDEFIILSGDADFTPLLLRIQEHARRSLVLSVGYTSPAYTAASSWRIREDWFIEQALMESSGEEFRDGLLPSENRPQAKTNPENLRKEHSTTSYASTSQQQRPKKNLSLAQSDRSRIVETVKDLVAESSVPVPLPSASQVLQRASISSPDWYGAGTLRDLLLSIDISPLEFSPVGQGYVFDPARHTRPEEHSIRDIFKKNYPTLSEFAINVHSLTDIPLLPPQHYHAIFTIVAEEFSKPQPLFRSEMIRQVEDRCLEEGFTVTPEQISFVLDAITRSGAFSHQGAAKTPVSTETIQKMFLERSLELCRLSQLPLGRADQSKLSQWLAGVSA